MHAAPGTEELLASLNDDQRRAVEWTDGPLIVLAGPGTGKTRVIIARIARLLAAGTDPETILGLTFSIKAAEEMRSRLAEAVGVATAQRVRLSTFHAFGKRVIDRFGDWIGLRPEPVLMDSALTRRLLRRLIREHNLFEDRVAQGREEVMDAVAKFIGACRNAGKLPEETLAFAELWNRRLSQPPAELAADPDKLASERVKAAEFAENARAYALFDRACRDEGLFTFDDLLTLPLRLVREKRNVASILRDEARHVLVDEFQDVNAAQIELLRVLAPPVLPSGRAPDLCVVGDDDQAIYGFRGADPRAFDHFASIWNQHRTVALTVNYRSAAPIVEAANAIISRSSQRFAPDKRNVPDPKQANEGGVEGVVVSDDGMLGQVIAGMILDDRAKHPERELRRYAVVVRANSTLSAIVTSMQLAGVPVQIVGEGSPLDDHGVQDLLAWARLLTNQDDTASALRLLTRPPVLVPVHETQLWLAEHRLASYDGHAAGFADWVIAEKSDSPGVIRFAKLLKDLREICARESADITVEAIVRRVDIVHAEALPARERAARVAHLVRVLRYVRDRQPHLEPPGDLASFLRYYDDLDREERQFRAPSREEIDAGGNDHDESDRPDAVQVLTGHKCKGLEFDTVFVAKVRPRGFPSLDREAEFPDLPAEFSGQAKRDHHEEERRIFYVACTRARRRLVLLAKNKKGRGSAVDYFIELTQDTPGLELPVSKGQEWLERLGRLDEAGELDKPSPATPRAARALLLAREIRRVRQDALAALHDAETASPAALMEIESSLARAARLIRGLAAIERGEAVPPAVAPGSPESQRLAQVESRAEQCAAGFSFAGPMNAPLPLSYTAVTEYQRCPRCFYLKQVMGYVEPRTGELFVGSVIHGAIEAFLKEVTRAEDEGKPAPGLERLLAIGDEHIRRATPRTQAFDGELIAQVRAQLRNYAEKLSDNAQLFRTEGSVTFPYVAASGGPAHRFEAKIDRVDRLPDGRWRIVDYKTGKPSKALLEPQPDDLQLCIYAMALPRLIDPAAVEAEDVSLPEGVAEYWLLGTGQRGSIDLSELSIDKVRKKIDEAIAGMLSGSWPRGEKCRGHCEGIWDE